MEVYIIFCFILFLFSFFEIFKSEKIYIRKIFLYLSFFGSVLIVGGRWETGTDWLPYQYMFNESNTWQNIIEIWQTEVGYGFFSWIIRIFTNNYTFFLIIHAIIFYGLLLLSFKRITPLPQTTFLLYFCSSLGILGSNRQLLALVFLLYGVSFLLNKKRNIFLYNLFVACTFHTTALIGAIYYFINRYISKKIIFFSIIIAFAFGISSLPLKLFGGLAVINDQFLYKTEAYLSTAKTSASEYSLTVIGVFKRLIFFSLFFVFRDKIISKFKNYNIFFNGYWIGILVYLVFSSSLNILVNRGSLYFNIMEPLLISSFFLIIKKPSDKILYIIFLLIISILLMFQSIGEYPEAFDPYKGIWYNSKYYRQSI